jgi:hypothetical protein
MVTSFENTMFRPLDDCFRCDPALGELSGTSAFLAFRDMGNLIQKILAGGNDCPQSLNSNHRHLQDKRCADIKIRWYPGSLSP